MHPFEITKQVVCRAVEEGLTPSICFAAGIGDETMVKVCRGRVSILEGAEEVTETTMYDMASLTKLMGPTMIALRLMQRGILDLADTLPRFFGDLVPEDKREISVYHLMTHTAGFLPSVRMDKLFKDPDKVLPYLMSSPLQSPPGTQVAYSCLGYIVLGKALEVLTGLPLDELAVKEVFGPLHMKDTGYHRLTGTYTTEHTAYTERSSFDDGWLVGRVHDENAFLLEGVSGNAGIFSNLNDCIRFARMLSCGGKLEGERYLSNTILRAAMQDQTSWTDNHKGLGFDLSGAWNSTCGMFFSPQAAGHTGFTGTTLYIDPSRTPSPWLVMLSNRVHPTRDNANMPRIRRTVMAALRADMDALLEERAEMKEREGNCHADID